ncbi:Light-mediated development protein DET1 [Glycine soja]
MQKVHHARRFYENLVPSYTVYEVECPDHSFRKFTDDGQYLINEDCDKHDLPSRAKRFDSFFTQLYCVALASCNELICKDFFLYMESNQFGLFSTSTAQIHDAPAVGGVVHGVPSIEKITFHLLRLEDGEILDKKVFSNDFVNLTHNMGVFLYDDLLAIVSLHYQTIHILQIRDSGNLVDVRAIGEFCREDDELFLNSNAQGMALSDKNKQLQLPGNHIENHLHQGQPNLGNSFLSGIKQRLLSFIFQGLWNEERDDTLRIQRLRKKFYFHFQDYVDLIIWKVQFLDRHHLLIKFGSVDGGVSRNADHHPTFVVVYNMDTTEIVSFYQNSPDELYLLFEQFCDHFHATSRNSMYMNFISSHSNNIHALEQLWSIKDKASSSAQFVKNIFESRFIVVKHGNNIRCSSLELASLNARNKSAVAECYTRTEKKITELMDDIRENVSVLTLLVEVLCLLDMIVNSFAHMISTKPVDRYTRPEFTENGPLAIDSGRHPILESIHNDFVNLSLLTAAKSKLSEAKKQYDQMVENKQLELSRHLKEISQRNDQAINHIKRKYELENMEIVNKEKEKADKAIAEIEAKCGQKIEECKEEQRQKLMRIQDEHTLLVTQMKQEHDKRQASLIAEHNEQLKRTQLQAANELREKTMFMRNDHEAQIKALRCELEDECRKLEEELHLQKSKEDRQRALLQLQWKVMSDKPKEDQEVNSKQVDLCFNLFVCVCLQMDAIFANFHVGIPLVVWFDILHLSFGRHSWGNEKTFLVYLNLHFNDVIYNDDLQPSLKALNNCRKKPFF